MFIYKDIEIIIILYVIFSLRFLIGPHTIVILGPYVYLPTWHFTTMLVSRSLEWQVAYVKQNDSFFFVFGSLKSLF